jgi:mannose-1-phosphate guanylyltransferase
MARYAMIMAGGSGTRLWPMSRAAMPKQLVPFIDGRSLLEIAGERIAGLVPAERRLVCAADAYRDLVLAAVPGLEPRNFLGEPIGRDTLNAVGFTAAVLAARDADAVFCVLTADHVITPQATFEACMHTGFALVEADPSRFATFAITPSHPATGYGYVEYGDLVPGFAPAVHCKRFVEKPDIKRAQEYVASGRFGWNSGMFVLQARTVLDAIARFCPASHAGLMRIHDAAARGGDLAPTVAEVYPSLPKVSVDVALMEPASTDASLCVCSVPMLVDWKDVGSWPSWGSTLPADEAGNRASCTTVHLGSTNIVVASDDPAHTVATIGLDHVVIVRTQDATLVCRADLAEQVKDLVARLPRSLR